ncbi:MAG: DUF1080 domain-containing protein [Gemmatimonadota bacterium]
MSAQRAVVLLVALGFFAWGLMSFLQQRGGDPADRAGAVAEQTADMAEATQEGTMAIARPQDVGGPPPAPEAGFEPLLPRTADGRFTKHGWNHYGPGHFTLDPETGVLATHGGMGLFWHAVEPFGDFTLRLQFQTSKQSSNSGVFLRVPEVPASDDYIYHAFEVQIDATAEEGIHRTGAVYDAVAPSEDAAKAPGEWNDMEISFVGARIAVVLNGTPVVDWTAEPAGKVRDFAPRGYVGLQNHDADSSVWFRNIRVKRLD